MNRRDQKRIGHPRSTLDQPTLTYSHLSYLSLIYTHPAPLHPPQPSISQHEDKFYLPHIIVPLADLLRSHPRRWLWNSSQASDRESRLTLRLMAAVMAQAAGRVLQQGVSDISQIVTKTDSRQ